MNTFDKNEQKIIDAFFLLAREYNCISNISISKIAERAGLTYQAIYKSHYKNPEEILQGLHYLIEKDIKTNLLSIPPKTGYSPFELLSTNILPKLYQEKDKVSILYGTEIDSGWLPFIEDKYSKWLYPYIKENHLSGLSQNFLTGLTAKFIIAIISQWITCNDPEHYLKFQKTFIELCLNASEDYIRPEYAYRKEN